MISKFAATVMVGIATFFLMTPNEAFAKSSNPAKTKKLEKQLKALGANAPASKVLKLVKALTKLDPAKAVTYVKLALKTDSLSIAESDKMTKQVVLLVQKSDLPDSKKNSIEKQSAKAVINYDPPAPTPTPYQAMVNNFSHAIG